MSQISFIYFDVGGVAIRDFSDSPKWEETAGYLGLPPDKKKLFFDEYKTVDDQICLGNLTIDGWIREVQNQLGIHIESDFRFLDYFIDNFAQNTSIWPLIGSVESNVKIGLLTDMWTGMYPQLVQRKLLPPFDWDVIIDSTVEHMRKPMPEIYKLAEQRAGVQGSEILFIDNREKNLIPARSRGWQTYLYDSHDYEKANIDLKNYLEKLL
jgi:FMN phosphatase YigB (HAD superfamily)